MQKAFRESVAFVSPGLETVTFRVIRPPGSYVSTEYQMHSSLFYATNRLMKARFKGIQQLQL